MEAPRASYVESSSGSDSESEPTESTDPTQLPIYLPPPPLSLLHPPNSLGTFDYAVQSDEPNRVRSFPHVEGNFALHVYIPGTGLILLSGWYLSTMIIPGHFFLWKSLLEA